MDLVTETDLAIEICSVIGMGLVTEMITGAVTGLCQETQMTSGKNLESPWVAGEVVTVERKEGLQAVIQIGAGEELIVVPLALTVLVKMDPHHGIGDQLVVPVAVVVAAVVVVVVEEEPAERTMMAGLQFDTSVCCQH